MIARSAAGRARNFWGDETTSEVGDAQAAEFNEERFRRVYDDTLGQAFAVARRLCGSDEDAADACQEAYLALYRSWSGAHLEGPPRYFLFTWSSAPRSTRAALAESASAARSWVSPLPTPAPSPVRWSRLSARCVPRTR